MAPHFKDNNTSSVANTVGDMLMMLQAYNILIDLNGTAWKIDVEMHALS